MRSKTELALGRSARLVLGLALTCSTGCRQRSVPADVFEVTYDGVLPKGEAVPTPPEAVLGPWRVWTNQERPMQKKTPEWRAYAAKESAWLELAAGDTFRCLLNPVRIVARPGEHGSLESWVASRRIRCSSDGFVTYVETQVRAQFEPNGSLSFFDAPAAVYLNEVVGKEERFTVVVLKFAQSPPPKPVD